MAFQCVTTCSNFLIISWTEYSFLSQQSPEQAARMWVFPNRIFLQGGVVSTSPKPQAGGPPLIGCLRLLIQFIRSYPLGRSSICNLRMRHAMVTGTHYMGMKHILMKFICTLYTVNKVLSVFFWTSSTVKIKTHLRNWLYFCLQVLKSAYQVGP